MMGYAGMQREVGAWVDRWFPNSSAFERVTSLGEEVGELVEALLLNNEKVREEIGDVVICMLDLCNKLGVDFAEEVVPLRTALQASHERLPVAYSNVCRAVLKAHQRIRGTPAFHRAALQLALHELLCLVGSTGFCVPGNVEAVVAQRWAVVGARKVVRHKHRVETNRVEPPSEEDIPAPPSPSETAAEEDIPF